MRVDGLGVRVTLSRQERGKARSRRPETEMDRAWRKDQRAESELREAERALEKVEARFAGRTTAAVIGAALAACREERARIVRVWD